eukprot:1194827-Prorocentrum_minimum.AAC.3
MPPGAAFHVDTRGAFGLSASQPRVWSLIIRSADVFHPIRPFRLHERWAVGITKEFAEQAKLESVLQGLPPPDERSTRVGHKTIAFLDFLVVPLVDRLARLIVDKVPSKRGFVDVLSRRLKEKHEIWLSYDKVRKLRLMSHRRNSSQCVSNTGLTAAIIVST